MYVIEFQKKALHRYQKMLIELKRKKFYDHAGHELKKVHCKDYLILHHLVTVRVVGIF